MPDPTLGACTRHEKHDFQPSFPSPGKAMRYQAERDEARAMAELWKETARKAIRGRDEWRLHAREVLEVAGEKDRDLREALRERDEAVTELRLYELREKLTPATVSPPLTPDAITDQFVDYVHEDYFWSTSDRVRLEKPALKHALLDAVKRIAEASARPEGAEEIEALLTGNYAEPKYVADFLAEHGVRVVTEEDDHAPACEGGPGQPCGTCASYWAGDQEEQP